MRSQGTEYAQYSREAAKAKRQKVTLKYIPAGVSAVKSLIIPDYLIGEFREICISIEFVLYTECQRSPDILC